MANHYSKGKQKKKSKKQHHHSKASIRNEQQPSSKSIQRKNDDNDKESNVLYYTSFLLPMLLVVWAFYRNHSTGSSMDEDLLASSIKETSSLQEEEQHSSCDIVMAKSAVAPNSGWGMFSTKHLPAQSKVLYGDLTIQLVDLQKKHVEQGLQLILRDYLWNSEVTGGYHEGTVVHSVISGFGMLANGHGAHYNVVPGTNLQMDAGPLKRGVSPGAGASSHYHGLHHYTRYDIPAGGELLVNYGSGWDNKIDNTPLQGMDAVPIPQRNVSWLMEHGVCLDNIRPGWSSHGRGAFATRSLSQGAVIAPAPLVPIAHRDALKITKTSASHQLLLNYCVGHANSSLLLYPYSPTVNYINHDAHNYNAKWEWGMEDFPHNVTLEQAKASTAAGLWLRVVAVRDIIPGEEILIDYGKAWQEAWSAHVLSSDWQNETLFQNYSYVSELNEQGSAEPLRTVSEQDQDPYPKNAQTSCYYVQQKSQAAANDNATDWEWYSYVYQLPNLHPCSILERHFNNETHSYTVRMKFRAVPGETPTSQVVKGVPRRAIRFTDRTYSTDQHLPFAFRHEIHLPDDLFPREWMDLS